MLLEQVTIDGNGMEEKAWEMVFLSKFRYSDKYIFRHDELNEICGAFSSAVVEIVEVFHRVMRLSLIGGTNQLYINLLFIAKSSVQLLFADIRSQQKQVMIFFLQKPPPLPFPPDQKHQIDGQ